MHLKTIIILLSLFISVNALGQRSISGVVKEEASGESLPYAAVVVKNTNIGTTSNQDGFFTLSDVPNEDIILTVSFIGFKPAEIFVDKNSDFITIELKNNVNSIGEVLVSSSSTNMMKMSGNVGQVTVSPKNISALPSLGEKDIFRSMQLLPGVSGSNEASSGLYVRGGTPDQNLVMFDGFTVYHVDHFYGFFSAFNSNAIKDVQLYKGGFESKFGGRTSSVVELTGKTGNEKQVKGGIGVGSISANGYLEIPLFNKGSFLVAYRRSLTDIIKSNLYDEIFDLNGKSSTTKALEESGLAQYANEPSFYFYDFNSKLTLKPSDKDVVSLSFYSGKDNLDNSRTNSSENSRFSRISFDYFNDIKDLTEWGNIGASAKWGRQWNTKLYSSHIFSFSNYFSDRNRFSETQIIQDDGQETSSTIGTFENNNLIDYSFKNDFSLQLNNNHTLEFGLGATVNDITYNYDLNDSINIVNRDDDGLSLYTYLQDTWKVNDQLNIKGGLRSSYYENTGKVYLEPRLQATYKITPKVKIKAAYGKYNQFVKRVIREDVMQGSRDFWMMTDRDTVPVSSAIHYTLGVSYEESKWLFDIEAYYKTLSGLSEYSPRISSSQDENNTSSFYTGTGTVAGVEFLLQRKFGDFTGWVAYTVSQVASSFPNISDKDYPASHDTPHEVKVVGSYKIGDFNFSATWVYATGKPYTEPIGGYTLTTLDGTPIDYIAVGDKNGARLPAYHRLDFSANYGFNIGKAKCETGLSLFNLYNRSNVWYKEYEKVDDSFLVTDVTFIGFTPNLFLTLKF